MVADSGAQMSKFVSGTSKDMVKEYRNTMLVKEMGTSRLMVHSQQIEEDKIKEKERESKSSKISIFNFSYYLLDGSKHSQIFKKSSAPTPCSTVL